MEWLKWPVTTSSSPALRLARKRMPESARASFCEILSVWVVCREVAVNARGDVSSVDPDIVGEQLDIPPERVEAILSALKEAHLITQKGTLAGWTSILPKVDGTAAERKARQRHRERQSRSESSDGHGVTSTKAVVPNGKSEADCHDNSGQTNDANSHASHASHGVPQKVTPTDREIERSDISLSSLEARKGLYASNVEQGYVEPQSPDSNDNTPNHSLRADARQGGKGGWIGMIQRVLGGKHD